MGSPLNHLHFSLKSCKNLMVNNVQKSRRDPGGISALRPHGLSTPRIDDLNVHAVFHIYHIYYATCFKHFAFCILMAHIRTYTYSIPVFSSIFLFYMGKILPWLLWLPIFMFLFALLYQKLLGACISELNALCLSHMLATSNNSKHRFRN